MSIETNLNTPPYYDDFNENKDFYKVLFRPGVALQARELTQLQDILQKQIERFGDHIFKSGTVISGVNFQFYEKLNYVKLMDEQLDGQPVDTAGYNGLRVKNQANLVAEVVNVKAGYESLDPETNYLFLNYLNSGDSGNTAFYSNSDVLTVYNKDLRLYDFVVNNGGVNISNSDTVVITSAVVVQSSNVTTGDVTQTIGANTANVTVIEANNTFGTIQVGSIRYKNTAGYTILKLRPINNDLANASANSAKWTINSGYNLIQGSNTANVVAVIGSNARAILTTDGSGIINDVSLLNGGSYYIIAPHVSIRSSQGTISTIDITALNYRGQVTVGANTLTANGTTPVGTGYGFGVTPGIIYQKGMFLRVEAQTIVVNAYTSNVNNVTVGFISDELIANSTVDSTLLDTATGTPNFAAPGAHRLKLTPTLTVINSSNVASNNTFFPLVDFREGAPYRQFQETSYSGIAKEFERRTDETNGNFVIDPFLVSSTDETPWSNTEFYAVVDPGLAYLDGVRVGTARNTKIPVRRGNDTKALTNESLSISYGNYILVNEFVGNFNFKAGSDVTLYNSATQYITNRLSTITPAGASVGTAKVRSVVFDSGTPGTSTAVYRVYLFDIRVDTGKSFKNDVKSIYYNGTGDDDGVADIILESDPTTGVNVALLYDSQFNSLVFPIDSRPGSKTVYETNNIFYSFRSSATANISTSAKVTVTIAGGNTSFPYGNNAVLTSTQRRDLVITPVVNATSSNVISSVTATASNTTVSGTGLTIPLEVGDWVKIYNGANTSQTAYTTVTSIANSSSMTVANAWAFGTASTYSAARHFPKYIPIPLDESRVSANINGGGTTLTINLSNTANELAFSSTANVNISYNAKVSYASQITKKINRGLLIKLDLSTNIAGTKGPWCLGIPDVFRLNAVYVGNSSVSPSSTNVTRYFYVNNGQNNDFYGHSHLVLLDKKKLTLTNTQYLLVEVDAFGINSPTDAGFFVIDSYALALNNATRSVMSNNYVAPVEVPDFKDSKGKIHNLAEVVDFRPRVVATANLISNSSNGFLTTNPANTISFGTHDKLFPQPDSTMLFDYNIYIGRQDRIIIDKNSNITVLEGRPNRNNLEPPVAPFDTMTLGILNVPPYPTSPAVPDDNQILLATKKVGSDNGILNNKYQQYTVTDDLGLQNYNLQPRRYTMADIGKLERRIVDLEYYTSLNELEKKIKDLNIPSEVDKTKNRFKNGFFVEPFDDYASTDNGNPESTGEIVQALSLLTPPTKKLNLQCRFNYSHANTSGSLRSEDPLAEPGLNNFGESVLMLPPNGTVTIVNQGKFTSAVTGTGGDYIFVGDMIIKPSTMKIDLKVERRITQKYRSPEPPRPAYSIVCGYMASVGLLNSEMNETDQQFGQWFKAKYPTSYRGYYYIGDFIVEALKGEAKAGFEFIKDESKRKKAVRSSTMFVLKIMAKDWAQYMAHSMQKNKYEPNLTGRFITYQSFILCYIIGLLNNNIDKPHDWKRAYTALFVGLSYLPTVAVVKPVDKLISKVKKFFKKG
jgi:hypothetical protein